MLNQISHARTLARFCRNRRCADVISHFKGKEWQAFALLVNLLKVRFG